MVMSYNGGLTFSKFIEKYLHDTALICRTLAKVATILDSIHKHGVGHNDLHAANIMIDEDCCKDNPDQDPVPTVIDFGFCLPFGSQLYEEQLEGWENYHYDPILSRDCGLTSVQTDIFSFAKLVEKIPFKCSTVQKQQLHNLVERALNPDKSVCPPLCEFNEALLHAAKGEKNEEGSSPVAETVQEEDNQK